jgi:uncharacterized phage protein (TIGR02220 family)
MINKNISDSNGFASLSCEAAVLFTMMIPHFNSHGKMNGGPGYIKDEICPLIPYLTYKNIKSLLMEISEKTNVKYFEFEGRWWIHSINFLSDHQTLNPSRLGEDLLPSYSRVSPELVPPEVEVEVEVKGKGEVEGKEKDKGQSSQVEAIIKDLNEKTGKNYRSTKDNKILIEARLKDGFTFEDFQKVHLNMATKWKDDPKMNQYLRPATLYQPKKFEGYLNAKVFLSDTGKVSVLTEKNKAIFEDFMAEEDAHGQQKVQ